MEPIRDEELLEALRATRPEPRPDFAADLDAKVAAGFPRRSRLRVPMLAGIRERLRTLKPRQLLLPAGAFALTAIVVATAVTSLDGSDSVDGGSIESSAVKPQLSFDASGAYPQGSTPLRRDGGPDEVVPFSASPARDRSEPLADSYLRATGSNAAFTAKNRAVERSAELTLGTDPTDVGDAAAEVFDVVHTHRGIVLRSVTSAGAEGPAEASFVLLIPSAKLADALAAFSGIAEVRSRREATADITAPTVGVSERLEDSRARIDSLLGQLAEAGTESEREAVEAELRTERNRAARLRSRLQGLERRANLSRVSVRIVSGEAAAPDAGGTWGVGNALDDAGRILAVAAAVTLVGLAILGPLALIALFAWLGHRAWLRRARRQALG